MAGTGKKGDDALVVALASGATVTLAARKAGLSDRTARRRLADAAFRLRVSGARSELVRRAVGKLAGAGALAVKTLRTLAKDATSEQVRLGAARALLEAMFRGHEGETLAREFEDLRELVEQLQANAEGGQTPERDPT